MFDNTNKIECACCGELCGPDDLTTVSDGSQVCQGCLDSEYVCCERCGDYVPNDEVVDVHAGEGWRTYTEMWCASCADDHAYQCRECGDYFTEGRLESTDPAICGSCFDDCWYHCVHCGVPVRVGDVVFDDDEDPCCADCAERHRRSIHNYSYKPAPDFAFRAGEDPATALTFGVELEVDRGGEDPGDTARAVTDAAEGRVYCKHDGSLDAGFEIVSHPASLAYHLYQMRWANLMRICTKAGFQSHDAGTCGLHVHVGRTGLAQGPNTDTTAIGNCVILATKLQAELIRFSRRTESQIAHWANFPDLDALRGGGPDTDDALTYRALRAVGSGRYWAVNLQNDATIEFRIFRGSLVRNTLAATLQLVNNLCRYAMTHTPTECLNATYADLVNVNQFKELVAYSEKRGLIVRPDVIDPET